MKSLRSIAFLVFALLVACTKQQTPPPPEEDMLYRVECFFQHAPDSALQIIDTLDITCLSEKEKAHYWLLKAELFQLTHKDHRPTDSLLQLAQDYFIGSDDKYHEARTYDIMAWQANVTQQEPQVAMDYRQKALQSILQCKHIDERLIRVSTTPTDEQNEILRLENAIRFRLGTTYSANHYFREGIDQLKPAEAYYAEKQRHSLRIQSAYMLGNNYLGL
ncbi:MAG: hypothetical protein IJ057_08860 [Bacteroidales bacterium]|nr:hypothetical protein [Bacteroidales bacterium]